MRKIIISLILCLSLCAGFLILPAAASSISDDVLTDAGTQYINYFDSNNFQSWNSTWSGTDLPVMEYTDTLKFAFKWTPENFETGNYMLFAVRSLNKPFAVSVKFTSSGEYVNATYEGAIPSAGNLYFYRVSMPSDPTEIQIWGTFATAYTGTVSIASCFGVRNLLSVYDRAQFSYVAIDRKTEGESVNKYEDVGTQFFPYSAPSWLSSTDYLTRVDFNLRCDGDRFNTSAVGKVKLLVTTYCETLRATVSLVGKDENVRDVDSIKVNISTDSAWGLVNQYQVGLGTMYNHSAYLIEFDLTGYDMSNYDLQIFLSVDTVSYVSEGSLKNKLFDLTFRSMQYVPTIINSPWYAPILSRLKDVGSRITSGISGVTSLMKTQYNNFTTWLDQRVRNIQASILSSTQSLKDYFTLQFEKYFGDDGALAEKGEAMQEQADQMQQANDAMNSVAKPSVDPGGMLDQYLTFNPTGLAILSVITGNPFATSMLVVIFTFALCGYIFFGKKR